MKSEDNYQSLERTEVYFDLSDFFSFFWRKKLSIILLTLFLFVSGTLALNDMPKKYLATSIIKVSDSELSSGIQTPDISSIGFGSPSNKAVHIETLRSRKFLRVFADDYKLHLLPEFHLFKNTTESKASLDHTVEILREDLSVSSIANTDMLSLSFVAHDPEVAAYVANTISTAFFEFLKVQKREQATTQSKLLNEKTSRIFEDLVHSESLLQDFILTNNIVDLNVEMELLKRQLVSLIEKKALASEQIDDLKVKVKQLDEVGDNTNEKMQLPIIASNNQVRLLLSTIQQKRTIYQEVSQRYKYKHHRYQAAKSALELAENQLSETIDEIERVLEKELKSLQARLIKIDSQIESLRERQSSLGLLEIQLSNLTREVQRNQKLYSVFLSRVQEAEIFSTSSNQAEYVVVDEAKVPIRPSSPRMALSLIVLSILSFGISVALFLLQHLTHDSHTLYKRVAKQHGIAVLAEFPKKPALDLFKGKKKTAKLLQDSVRSFDTLISILTRDNSYKSFAFTSVKNDKAITDMAIRFASSHARIERTVLVEADLRNRPLSNQLMLDKEQKGITDLVNLNTPFSQASYQTENNKLTILSAGSLNVDATSFFAKEKFSEVMTKIRKAYKRVIVTTAPILESSDVFVVAKQTDALILFCDVEKTKVRGLMEALEQLSISKTFVLGVVLVNVPYVDK
uniref:GumC family protein n=1 Tax=Ningiella ruwaisensis TaxID=2364274 RepID=UPI00109F3534|nr:polysaccharide biosynthesis tyrosine autokinase [Ningiella ruwaisensis]